MKHPTSRMLHAYWERLRGERAAPDRAAIEPGAIRHLLSDSLILGVDLQAGDAAFRLAGTRVCALFGHELKGKTFAGLWGVTAAEPMHLIEAVAGDTVGLVAGLRGYTDADDCLDLELLLLPLRHHGRTESRILGALSPHTIPSWLGLRPVVRLETLSLRILDQALAVDSTDAEAMLRNLPAPANDSVPVRRGHLMVHRGGRA